MSFRACSTARSFSVYEAIHECLALAPAGCGGRPSHGRTAVLHVAQVDDDDARPRCEPLRMHARRSILLALLVSVAVACETSPSPSGPSGAPSASAAAPSTQVVPDGSGGTGPAASEGDGVAAARSIIEAADPADAATIDAVDTV